MRDIFNALRAVVRFRGYLPQRLTVRRVLRWIQQFAGSDRKHVWALLNHIVYLSEPTVREILVDQNRALMNRLLASGLRPHQLIYVQVHDAGSSSPVMLNMLRDAAQLEQRGCEFVDSQNTLRINEITNDIAEGALIYVDDFVGSGIQLSQARDFAVQHVVGTFSEFVLAASICEEGQEKLEALGIEAYCGHVHTKADRPLHEESDLFGPAVKSRLQEICEHIEGHVPLGFGHMAVMVVLYRNAPDNVPVLLRGSQGQHPYTGVFPRTTDLPIRA